MILDKTLTIFKLRKQCIRHVYVKLTLKIQPTHNFYCIYLSGLSRVFCVKLCKVFEFFDKIKIHCLIFMFVNISKRYYYYYLLFLIYKVVNNKRIAYFLMIEWHYILCKDVTRTTYFIRNKRFEITFICIIVFLCCLFSYRYQ